tara:strand:+ start:8745 stop:9083 length:339 start_codon:yes stop_codon:yes gene_type:complete
MTHKKALTPMEEAAYTTLVDKKFDHIDYSIPINFPTDWTLKFMPPLGGAMLRFLVNGWSVYLDGDNSLGAYPEGPYLEIAHGQYPRFEYTEEGIKEFIEYVNQATSENNTPY